jgi:hypothetical protein
MLQLRPSSTLDGGDFGWLKAKHHFAVRPDGNPANGPLGALMVWNDDEIAPGTGFGLHGHANMEIISYVREGLVTHRDSIGNVGRTEAGDVQAISAGAGIRHSEHNLGAERGRVSMAENRTGARVVSQTRIAPTNGSFLQAGCQTVSTRYPFALTERCLERHSSPAGNFNTTLATSTPLISYPHEALLK